MLDCIWWNCPSCLNTGLTWWVLFCQKSWCGLVNWCNKIYIFFLFINTFIFLDWFACLLKLSGVLKLWWLSIYIYSLYMKYQYLTMLLALMYLHLYRISIFFVTAVGGGESSIWTRETSVVARVRWGKAQSSQWEGYWDDEDEGWTSQWDRTTSNKSTGAARNRYQGRKSYCCSMTTTSFDNELFQQYRITLIRHAECEGKSWWVGNLM